MKKPRKRKSIIALCLVFTFFTGDYAVFAQNGGSTASGPQLNAIQTAVPFMTITPDSRAGALGEVGVATSPDINSQNWNPAKYPFIESEGGVALSYTPWLRKLINDINLAYLVGFYKFGDRQVVSASLRYFSLGQIVFTNNYGTPQGVYVPNEFAVDAGYSRLLTDRFSGGIVFRFIRSDLTGGVYINGTTASRAAIAIAGDLAFYYRNTDLVLGSRDGTLGLGVNISNMGNKVAYTETSDKTFLPINLKLGGALTIDMDDYNSITFMADLNKLLVPTPPIYAKDSLGGTLIVNGEKVIEYGRDPNIPTPVGMVQSFYDAPGVLMEDGSRSVFREEFNEIMFGLGLEYWYREQFAIRAGYFYEHETKGNRKYFTLGVGLKLNVFELDFSYLVPVKQNNPLANTLRFTLGFEFGKPSF